MRPIDEINAELAEMRVRITALEAEKSKAAPPARGKYVEPETTLHYPAPASIEMPNNEEMAGLLRIALAAYPSRKPAGYDSDGFVCVRFLREFGKAFREVSAMERGEAPNPKWSISHWHNKASDACRLRGDCTEVDPAAFFYAVLASGDIPWQAPDPSLGAVLSYGLIDWGGKRATDAWRTVLATGKIKPPTKPAVSNSTYSHSGVEVRTIQQLNCGGANQY